MTEYDTTQGTLIKSLQQTLLRITLMLEIIVAAFSVAFSNAFSRHHPGGGLLPQGGHGRQR